MYSSYKTNSVKKNNKLYTKFDSWFLKNGMKIQSYLSSKKGNCLVESVSLFLVKNPKIFGIEHGLIMLCEFL